MSSFTNREELCPLPDGRRWEVLSPFTYEVGALGEGGELITVPAGFITDLASVPRALWIIFPPFGKYTGAATIHDYLYVMGGKIPGGARVYTKAYADGIFREACLVEGVGKIKAWLMWKAVCIGGKGNF